MVELGIGPAILRTIGGLYLLFWLVCLIAALWTPKTAKIKAVCALVVMGLFSAPIIGPVIEEYKYRTRYEEAKVVFEKLCAEQTKPVIKRTVEGVDGILLLKQRPTSSHADWSDQMWAGAALSGERTGVDGDAEYYLLDWRWRETEDKSLPPYWETLNEIGGKSGFPGFKFVDLPGSTEKTRIRVTARLEPGATNRPVYGVAFDRVETTQPPPRYAVNYLDNLDPELRNHWIAGTTLQVVDTETNEVIGSQSHWRWDPLFGSRHGFRLPWPLARQCPVVRADGKRTQLFVHSVLRAKKEN